MEIFQKSLRHQSFFSAKVAHR